MRDFCRRILEAGDLDSKLAPPSDALVPLSGPRLSIDRPARDPELTLRADVAPLPRPGKLSDPNARAICLARFAHHELMAVELFAWALLRWPDLPESSQRGLLGVLREEQVHCRLYLDRLAAHGSGPGEHACSDYFWKHVPAIIESPAGYPAFLAAMGLTLEQGNLDFAPLYRDAFRSGGDEASARVCERVHRDEIGHVRFAALELRAHAPAALAGASDIALYEWAVPFPLSAARAKGRRFEAKARREAGLEDDFIEYVREAKSPLGRPLAERHGPRP